jgi:hypothetical protein
MNMMTRERESADSRAEGEPLGPVYEGNVHRICSNVRDGEPANPSAVPPSPRPDRRGRRGRQKQGDPECLPAGPQRREGASALARPEGKSDQACAEIGPINIDMEGTRWVMPWERQPSWMYLPHLLDRAEGYRQGGAEDHRPEGASGSSSGWGSVGANRGLQPHGAEGATSGGPAGEGPGGHAIRGQPTVPGPENAVRRSGEADGAVPTTEEIRGLPMEPGAQGGGGARTRAQQRLEARNAHLSISLAQHADRVRKRRQQCPNAGEGPTPSERVAALKRRIEEKRMRGQAHSATSGVGVGTSNVSGMEEQSRQEPAVRSNEDPNKIHYCMNLGADVIGIQMDTAGGGGGGRRRGAADGCSNGTLDSAARGGGQSAAAGGAAVPVETAAVRAAYHVAWHTSSGSNDAGE